MKFYRQCILQHDKFITVAWIEERGAKLGFSVTLKDSEDPNQLWEVTFVGAYRIPKDMIECRSRDYLYQRQASDV